MKAIVKVIEMEDHYVDNSHKYPYILSMESSIRITLKSKKVAQYEPVLVIDQGENFQPLLPRKTPLDMKSKEFNQFYESYRGNFDIDGQWECKLEQKNPGVVNFQIGFTQYGQQVIEDWGQQDIVLLFEQKVDMKKMRLMTVFPRCIGKSSLWTEFFNYQMKLGYNIFHFAPIQQTGSSNSYYSIANQNELSSSLFEGSSKQRYDKLSDILLPLQKKGGMFFVDILLNHTSFDSEWIQKHPDATFTIENTPKLTSAYILDKAVRDWGDQLKLSLDETGVPMDDDVFGEIQKSLTDLIKGLHLEDFFFLPEDVKSEFLQTVPVRKPSQNLFAKDPCEIILEFIKENVINLGCYRKGVRVSNIKTKFAKLNPAYEEIDVVNALKIFNKQWNKKILDQWIPEIIDAFLKEIRHNYLANRYRSFSDPYPFVQSYFSFIISSTGHEFAALNNGWTYQTNQDIATNDNFLYLRRKINSWGDLVRIRYGEKPGDTAAWEYMANYVRKMAHYFDGFRLDNLHGTQINVGDFMIKEARKVKPKILIFAELFTNSDEQKAMFVRRMGITCTLKEMKYLLSGHEFINAFHHKLVPKRNYMGSINPYFESDNEFIKYSTRKIPIALLYDQTHDNSGYEESKKVIIKTPMTLLLETLGTFIGSTKGFDQFYSHSIKVIEMQQLYSKDVPVRSVVDKSEIEKRKILFQSKEKVQLFGSWDDWKEGHLMIPGSEYQQFQLELPPGKYQYKFFIKDKWVTDPLKELNKNSNHEFQIKQGKNRTVFNNLQPLRQKGIEYRNSFEKMDEYFAYNDGDIVVLVREACQHENAICVIANLSTQAQKLKEPILLPGIHLRSEVWYQSDYEMYQGFFTDVQIVNHGNVYEYFDTYFLHDRYRDVLYANQIPPGFSCLIYCQKSKERLEATRSIEDLVNLPIKIPSLGALDYNMLMYGADNEELTRFGEANYVLPKSHRKLIYGGFGGILAELKKAKRENILSLELFDNLREGDWILDYYLRRVKRFKNLTEVIDILERFFQNLKQLPKYLKPKYFVQYIIKFCDALEKSLCSSPSAFQRHLVMSSNQFITSFNCDKPLFKITLAAGLPHFCTGWARAWGRDTFISNELLLLHPNIYRDIIIQFASALRHGLIPNLLDSGNNPRYNSRDACWWFIRGVNQYAQSTKDYSILKAKVKMLFLDDDLLKHKEGVKEGRERVLLLEQVIHKIFESHASGITFREWYAGYEIDSNMKSQGFNISLKVHEQTGFIVGGNSFNCLTWMDKMGSSDQANNRGYPATPRAGAPVELVGLLYYCLTQYDKLNKDGHYSFNHVNFHGSVIKLSQWADIIAANFQSQFYLEGTKGQKYPGIYRDVVHVSEHLFYQSTRLRPNALIALALAPSLFHKQHALSYLRNVEHHLLFPKSLGVATLGDLHDSLYCPYYDNNDDSTDLKTAHGFSYHNGPEWVWPYGFYVAAKSIFSAQTKKCQLLGLLQEHMKYIERNEWLSLPEMTNRNGEQNGFSCAAQAWSISSMLLGLKHLNEGRQYL